VIPRKNIAAVEHVIHVGIDLHAEIRRQPHHFADAYVELGPSAFELCERRDQGKLEAAGLRNREIGRVLGISEQTVHGHLRNIFEKLNVTDRMEGVRVALRRGIIHVS
jgi:DNA-binding NarL/FixJ family response regulator